MLTERLDLEFFEAAGNYVLYTMKFGFFFIQLFVEIFILIAFQYCRICKIIFFTWLVVYI